MNGDTIFAWRTFEAMKESSRERKSKKTATLTFVLAHRETKKRGDAAQANKF